VAIPGQEFASSLDKMLSAARDRETFVGLQVNNVTDVDKELLS
jgi:hypothetical protein